MTMLNSRNEAIAAMLAMFILLLGTAQAAVYDSCPYSTKVDGSWWNADGCEGGIYGYGSLYLKWPDAPFDNESTEVTSTKLIVSGVSQGTDFIIYMWNGYSWSGLYGGTIDFSGDYVYDLDNVPGPYMDGSMRIKVINRGPETININSIRIVIEHRSTERELSVEVRDCSSNNDVEDVKVAVKGNDNEYTEETNDDGIASFSLYKDNTYTVTVGGDDYSEVKRTVYLSDDTDLKVCTYHVDKHAVDVRDLEVNDDVIEFTIENTGNVDNDDITYRVLANDKQIFQGLVTLDVNEEDDITGAYDFAPGRYKIKARAETHGYADSDVYTYCVEGVTDNYMCSGDKLLRETINQYCTSVWETVKTCDDGCHDGSCGYIDGETDSGVCGFDITTFSYVDGVPSNKYEYVDITVKNTGDDNEAKVNVYADGKYMDTESVYVKSGEAGTVNFRFMLASGTHTVKADVLACGSVKDTATGKVKVTSPTVAPGVPQGPEPEDDFDEIEGVKVTDGVTAVYIENEPGKLFTEQYEGVTLKVTLYPPGDSYRFSVTGVPQSWLDYPKVVDTSEKGYFYVYVSPQEGGEYTLTLRAWTDGGSVSKEEDVKLTVTPVEENLIVPVTTGADDGSDNDGLTGMASLSDSPLFGFTIAFALMATILILVFTRHYMVETHNYDSDWGNAPLNYDEEVKKAAIDDFSGF